MNRLALISLLLVSLPVMAQRTLPESHCEVGPGMFHIEPVRRPLAFMPPFAPVPSEVNVGELPDCVDTTQLNLHFPTDGNTLDHFYSRLQKVLLHGAGNVNVWHIGGSHVQAGYLPHRIMEDFHTIAPWMRGERGFVFPYRMAATNYDGSYRMRFEGKWTAGSAKSTKSMPDGIRYGITGMAGVTEDNSSSVSLVFSEVFDRDWEFDRLRVMGHGSSEDSYPYLVWQSDTLRSRLDSLTMSYMFDLPEMTDSVMVFFNLPEGENFTLCGMEPLSGRGGVNYFASGINGATLGTWLSRCADMPRDLELVKPDLVIMGLGINDSACPPDRFDPDRFKDNYRDLIGIIRGVSPDCDIVFVTNNDSYRYVRRGMTHNDNGIAVQKAMYELAGEYGAAVWDLFGVMGGNRTVLRWRDEGLVKPDKLHFTKLGYQLVGDLLFNAIVRDYCKYLTR